MDNDHENSILKMAWKEDSAEARLENHEKFEQEQTKQLFDSVWHGQRKEVYPKETSDSESLDGLMY